MSDIALATIIILAAIVLHDFGIFILHEKLNDKIDHYNAVLFQHCDEIKALLISRSKVKDEDV